MNIETPECFQVGSEVACTTCFGQRLQGEVTAFDWQTKLLSIKNPSTSGKPGTFDISLINMNMVSAVSVIKEAADVPQPLANLNYAKLMQRTQVALSEKQRAVLAIGVGVPAVAQRLYNTIAKTIDEIKWGGKDGKDISIMGSIFISPPYGLEGVRGHGPAFNHVRKIVEKFYRDEERRDGGDSADGSSAGSSESSKSNTPTPFLPPHGKG